MKYRAKVEISIYDSWTGAHLVGHKFYWDDTREELEYRINRDNKVIKEMYNGQDNEHVYVKAWTIEQVDN